LQIITIISISTIKPIITKIKYHLLPGRLSFESAIPKNVVDQMNDALVQNMGLLHEQAMHIHSAEMQTI
jgi:hypothetical protein